MSLILSGSNGLSDVDGSASTPAIRGTDANTGIFFGADIIGFSEGGAECARFNADSQFVAAAGTASLPVLTTTGDLNTGVFYPAADTVALTTGGSERTRITSTGQLIIGTTSSNYTFRVNFETSANVAQIGLLTTGGSGGEYPSIGYNVRYTASSGSYTYSASDFASMLRFSQNSGRIETFTAASGTGGNAITFTTGPYVSQGGTSWTSSSDERLKNITGEIQNGLTKVCALRAAEFTWKSDEFAKPQVGLIAQDLVSVLPQAVVTSEVEFDGTPATSMGVNYDQTIPLLVAAIKELKAELDAAKARIAVLEAK